MAPHPTSPRSTFQDRRATIENIRVKVNVQPHNIATNVQANVESAAVNSVIDRALARVQSLIGQHCDAKSASIFLSVSGEEPRLLDGATSVKELTTGADDPLELVVKLSPPKAMTHAQGVSMILVHLVRSDLGSDNVAPIASVQLFPSRKATVAKIVEKAIGKAQSSLGKALISDRFTDVTLVGTDVRVQPGWSIAHLLEIAQETDLPATLHTVANTGQVGQGPEAPECIQLGVVLDFEPLGHEKTPPTGAKSWITSLTRRNRTSTFPARRGKSTLAVDNHKTKWRDGAISETKAWILPSNGYSLDAVESDQGLNVIGQENGNNMGSRQRCASAASVSSQGLTRMADIPDDQMLIRVLIDDQSMVVSVHKNMTVSDVKTKLSHKVIGLSSLDPRNPQCILAIPSDPSVTLDDESRILDLDYVKLCQTCQLDPVFRVRRVHCSLESAPASPISRSLLAEMSPFKRSMTSNTLRSSVRRDIMTVRRSTSTKRISGLSWASAESLFNPAFIRLKLANGAATNVPLTDSLTVRDVLVTAIRRQLKMERGSPNAHFSISTGAGNDALLLEDEIHELPYVTRKFAEGAIPCLNLFFNEAATRLTAEELSLIALSPHELMASQSLSSRDPKSLGDKLPNTLLITIHFMAKISTTLLVEKEATIEQVIETASVKFKNLFGEMVHGSDASLCIHGREGQPFSMTVKLRDIVYVQEMVERGETPSFSFEESPLDDAQLLDDILGDYEMSELEGLKERTRATLTPLSLMSVISLERLREKLDLMLDYLGFFEGNQAISIQDEEPFEPSWMDEALLIGGHRAARHLHIVKTRRFMKEIHKRDAFLNDTYKVTCIVPPRSCLTETAQEALRTYMTGVDPSALITLQVQGNVSLKLLKRRFQQQPEFPDLPLPEREFRLCYRQEMGVTWMQAMDEMSTIESLSIDGSDGESAMTFVLLPRIRIPRPRRKSSRNILSGLPSFSDNEPELQLLQVKLQQLGGTVRIRQFRNIFPRNVSTGSWKSTLSGLTSATMSVNSNLYSLEGYEEGSESDRESENDCQNLIIQDVIGPAAPDHLSMTIRTGDEVPRISSWDVTSLFSIEVIRVENLAAGSRNFDSVFVECGLFHGIHPLSSKIRTSLLPFADSVRFNETITFKIAVFNLPRYCRLAVTVFGKRKKSEDVVALGGCNQLLFDFQGVFIQSQRTMLMNANEAANAVGICSVLPTADSPNIQIRFQKYQHPIIFPKMIVFPVVAKDASNSQVPSQVQKLFNRDSLAPLTEEDRQMIWHYRSAVVTRPEWLHKVVDATSWDSLSDVIEIYSLIEEVADLPEDKIVPVALGLLGGTSVDARVRAWAVSQLNILTDEQLAPILLQLVQAMKYEPYLDSALCRFVFVRALCNHTVGQLLFWLLKSEITTPGVPDSFRVILEMFIRFSGQHTDDLEVQTRIVECLSDVSQTVKKITKPAERKATMNTMLEVRFRAMFNKGPARLAVKPNVSVVGIALDKFRVMDSKMAPVWCVFTTDDPEKPLLPILFKLGDDLRQDMLTLQMITMMDNLWKANGLDLQMSPYSCLQTGHKAGMIEAIAATTVSSIQLAYGGSIAAFREETIAKWIEWHCKSSEEYLEAAELFTLSCAGYCVATYCLGIGDRHNGNIMVTKGGKLFHIDFGHFLGNIKRKFGIKRERAPFVLTPDFIFVINSGRRSDNFERFCKVCRKAYNILRGNADFFINAFAMMVCTGAPELTSYDDIEYLRDALSLGMNDTEAAEEFQSLIYESLRLGWSTQLNWWVHNIVHK